MIRKNNCIPFFMVLFFGKSVFGQMAQYNYKRAIPVTAETWNKIVLPDELFGKLKEDLSDIRIYGITPKNDTITAPYLLREAAENKTATEVAARLINQARNAKGYYFTFEIATATPINTIALDFKQDNFDWRIQLEGSQDQQEWFTLLDNYRVLSISNKMTDYRFTTLRFPDAKYRYYRLLVRSTENPVLRSAKSVFQQQTAGSIKKYSIINTRVRLDKQQQQTIINVQLAMPVPVSRVKIYVHDKVDYYRPVTLQYAADSFKIAEGWSYQYQSLATATLTSIEPNDISVNSTITDKLQLLIDNRDNQALKNDSIAVSGYEQSLVVRFAAPASYWLVYGNSKALPPDYDISRFTDKIPAALTTIQMGDEVLLEKEKPVMRPPLFQNKAWLWALLILIIVIIGGFSVTMMKKAGNK